MHLRNGIALAALAALLAALPACQTTEDSSAPQDPAVSAGAWSSQEPAPSDVSQPEPEPEPEPEPLTQAEVAQVLEEVMAGYSAIGVSAAVIEDGMPGASAAWGWAVNGEEAMTPDTKVRVASLSKVIVGMCAAAMAEDGLADLDAPLSAYWGSSVQDPYAQTQPSIRTLMSHSSGIKDFSLTRGVSKLRRILSSPSSWRGVEPGSPEAWYYSNFGASVLGSTLELASGQLLDDYLQSRFLQPLDIRASLYAGRMAPEEVAVLYGSGGTILRTRGQQAGQTVPTEIGAGSTYYPGGLTISAKDLATLVSVLSNDGAYQTDVQAAGDSDVAVSVSCLSPESVEAMETAQFSVTPENGTAPFDQCLVLRHQEDLLGRDQLYYHTGNAYGVYSLLTYDPDTGDGVVVITTGAAYRVDDRGLYELPAQLSQALYAKMEEHDG